MSSFRVNRISEDVKKELVDIIRVLKDPRIKHGVISIVKAEVTSDLSYATVYVSSLDGIEDAREAVKGFESAAGYIPVSYTHLDVYKRQLHNCSIGRAGRFFAGKNGLLSSARGRDFGIK